MRLRSDCTRRTRNPIVMLHVVKFVTDVSANQHCDHYTAVHCSTHTRHFAAVGDDTDAVSGTASHSLYKNRVVTAILLQCRECAEMLLVAELSGRIEWLGGMVDRMMEDVETSDEIDKCIYMYIVNVIRSQRN